MQSRQNYSFFAILYTNTVLVMSSNDVATFWTSKKQNWFFLWPETNKQSSVKICSIQKNILCPFIYRTFIYEILYLATTFIFPFFRSWCSILLQNGKKTYKVIGFYNYYGINILKTYSSLYSLIFFPVPKAITFLCKIFTKIESFASITLSTS